ncbi:MAG: branched-chain amino acid ABC transporter permease, partial [Gammaproteobacteria bacterium]|nr:branched-chain amino acid ABC transporter permease [Gammaproteobacteria bacterium]
MHRLLPFILTAGVVIALPHFLNNSQLNTLILALMAAQLGIAWNIIGGYTGQVSLGHATFFGIGAYTSTLLLLQLGISPWLGMLVAGILAVVISVLVGWSCFRLKGHYFAMATIAIAELLQILVNEWDFAGGAVGLYVPLQHQGWWWLNFTDKKSYYWLALGLLILSLGVCYLIEKSYLGYYFRAIKDEPSAAESIGIPVARYKQLALAISAVLTALGGVLYAQKELYIDPNSVLSTAVSIKMSLVAILGGVGSILGPVLGGIVLIALEETTRQVFGGSGKGTDIIIYGALILLMSVF